jgi:hypothetical protein
MFQAPTSGGSASNRYGSGKSKVLDEKYLLHSYFACTGCFLFRTASPGYGFEACDHVCTPEGR